MAANILDILIKVREDGTSRAVNRVRGGLGDLIKQGAILSTTFLGVQATLRTVFNGIRGTVQKGIKAVDDYQVSVASLSAITLTFMDIEKESDVAEGWRLAQQYATGLVPVIEEISAQTLLSGEQANLMAREFAKSGQIIDAGNENQVQGIKNIANALFIMTGGLNLERQIVTEIGHLMNGQITSQDLLGKLLIKINPELKDQLKTWIAQGTAVEEIGNMLSGFEPATKDLATSWNAVKSTLDTVTNQILRDGMRPLYEDITGSVLGIKDILLEHKAILAEDIAKTIETIKNVLRIIWDIVLALEGPLKLIGGLVATIAKGWGYVFAVLPSVSERVVLLLQSVWEMVEAMGLFGKTLWQVLSLDFEGAMATFGEAKGRWQKSGETAGKAMASGLKGEIDQALLSYDALGKPKGGTTEDVTEKVKGLQRKIVDSEKDLTKSVFAMLSAETTRAKESLKTATAIIKDYYDQGLIDLVEYYDTRKEIVKSAFEFEKEQLEKRVALEKDPAKKTALQTKIYSLEENHAREMIRLNSEQRKAEEDLAQKEQDKLAMMEDLKFRASDDRQAQFALEMAELDSRHAEEISKLRDLKATESEINEAYRLQELEKDKVLADQQKRLLLARLEDTSTVVGGMSDIFGELYEATGKDNKTLFRLQKAFAIAQATMNIATAITRALMEGGPFMGPIQAGIIAALGGIQIAKIASQSMAAGGPVFGGSGTQDDVPILAMGGEYVQPKATVRHYGVQVMEALRRKIIPRDVFKDYLNLGFTINRPAFAFAGGGMVGPKPEGGASRQEVNITNIVDPGIFDQYLATTQGNRSIINVVSANAFQIKRILDEGG